MKISMSFRTRLAWELWLVVDEDQSKRISGPDQHPFYMHFGTVKSSGCSCFFLNPPKGCKIGHKIAIIKKYKVPLNTTEQSGKRESYSSFYAENATLFKWRHRGNVQQDGQYSWKAAVSRIVLLRQNIIMHASLLQAFYLLTQKVIPGALVEKSKRIPYRWEGRKSAIRLLNGAAIHLDLFESFQQRSMKDKSIWLGW